MVVPLFDFETTRRAGHAASLGKMRQRLQPGGFWRSFGRGFADAARPFFPILWPLDGVFLPFEPQTEPTPLSPSLREGECVAGLP